MPSARCTSRSVIARPSRWAWRSAAISSARRRPRRVGQAAHRERRVIPGCHDIGAVPRPPDLDEGRVVERRGRSALDTRMDREQRRARHAVLEPGRGGTSQRADAPRHALVERLGASAIREDLLSCQSQSRPGCAHRTSPTATRMGPRIATVRSPAPRFDSGRPTTVWLYRADHASGLRPHVRRPCRPHAP